MINPTRRLQASNPHQVPGQALTAGTGTLADDRLLHLPAAARGRFVKVTLAGRSTRDLPIPAGEAPVEVVLRQLGALSAGAGGPTA